MDLPIPTGSAGGSGSISVPRMTFESGNMTEEEKALGFPLSTLATHTEARASKTELQPGDVMNIQGDAVSCVQRGDEQRRVHPGRGSSTHGRAESSWPGTEQESETCLHSQPEGLRRRICRI